MPIRLNRSQVAIESPVQQASRSAITPVQPVAATQEATAGSARDSATLAERIFRRERDQEISTRVRELAIQRRQADGEVLNEYTSATGVAAVEGRAEAMQRIRANSKKVLDSIQDREVRELFRLQDAALTQASDQQLDRHYRAERRSWTADTLAASRDTLREAYRKEVLSEDLQSPEAQRIRTAYLDEIQQLGELEGVDQQRIDLRKKAYDSDTYVDLVQDMLAEDRTEDAVELFERVKDDIEQDAATELRDRLQTASYADQAQDLADDFAGVPLLEALESLRKMSDDGLPAEVRRQAQSMIEHQDSVLYQQTTRTSAQQLEAMQDWATANPNEPFSWDQVLELEEQGNLTRMQIWLNQGKQWITTEKGLNALLNMPDAVLRGYRSSEQLTDTWREHLDNTDLKALVRKWEQAWGRGGSGQGTAASQEERRSQMLIEAMQDKGWLPVDAEPNVKQTNRRTRLQGKIQQRAEAMADGHPVTNTMWQEAMRIELGNLITVEEGQFPRGAVFEPELDTARFVFDTGEFVRDNLDFQSAEADVVRRQLHVQREEDIAFNRSLQPGQRPRPVTDVTERAVAEVFFRERQKKILEDMAQEAIAERKQLFDAGRRGTPPAIPAWGQPFGLDVDLFGNAFSGSFDAGTPFVGPTLGNPTGLLLPKGGTLDDLEEVNRARAAQQQAQRAEDRELLEQNRREQDQIRRARRVRFPLTPEGIFKFETEQAERRPEVDRFRSRGGQSGLSGPPVPPRTEGGGR